MLVLYPFPSFIALSPGSSHTAPEIQVYRYLSTQGKKPATEFWIPTKIVLNFTSQNQLPCDLCAYEYIYIEKQYIYFFKGKLSKIGLGLPARSNCKKVVCFTSISFRNSEGKVALDPTAPSTRQGSADTLPRAHAPAPLPGSVSL